MRFSSCARQSIRSHRTGALRGWSSGLFTRRAAAVTPATAGTTYRPPSHTGVEKLSPVIASNLPFGSGGPGRLASPAHLPHVSALSRPGTRPGIRPVMPRPGGAPGKTARVSRCLSATGIRFLGILSRPGIPPLSRSAYRARQQAARTRAGFPCSARVRHGWGRVPSLPRGLRCLHGQLISLAAARRLPAAGPYSPR